MSVEVSISQLSMFVYIRCSPLSMYVHVRFHSIEGPWLHLKWRNHYMWLSMHRNSESFVLLVLHFECCLSWNDFQFLFCVVIRHSLEIRILSMQLLITLMGVMLIGKYVIHFNKNVISVQFRERNSARISSIKPLQILRAKGICFLLLCGCRYHCRSYCYSCYLCCPQFCCCWSYHCPNTCFILTALLLRARVFRFTHLHHWSYFCRSFSSF